jgi:hypothetical protein
VIPYLILLTPRSAGDVIGNAFLEHNGGLEESQEILGFAWGERGAK